MCVKISVVIPTLKRPELLVNCLTALKRQSLPPEHYEVIVVTDGPDNTTKNEVAYFIDQHPLENVVCIALPRKAGPAAARNKGAGMAKGELIAFTDDDCIPDVDWLKAWWAAYTSQQKSEIAFTGKTIVPHGDRPTDYEKNIAHLQTAEFITANCACTPLAFNKAGGFDEEFPIAWREDSDLHFKFIIANIPVAKVANAIVTHPVRQAKWGISIKEQKKSRYNALLHKKHPRLYKEKIGIKPLWNYYAIVILLPLAIVSFLTHKPTLAFISGACGVTLVIIFIMKRLNGTSKRPWHVFEMIATSVVIPFLSVFWTLYGAFRYKKLLL